MIHHWMLVPCEEDHHHHLDWNIMFLIEEPQCFLSTETCMCTGPVFDSRAFQKIAEASILHFFYQFIGWLQLLIRMGRTTDPSIRQAIAHLLENLCLQEKDKF